jgi:Invasin, domain 3
MKRDFRRGTSARRWRTWGAALLLIAATNGCGLDEVDVPDLVGPSENGISLQMQASPDIVNADGVSQSVIRITVRDQDGRPAQGRQLLVTFDGDGFLVAGSVLVGPLQNAISVATDANGIAQVVYVAGFAAGSTVTVSAITFGTDINGRFGQTVDILLI